MDERSLIRSAQRGEKKAFQDLIAFYYPYVLKFLLKMTHDSMLSEDLAQDTFVKLIRGIDRFDLRKKAAFSTWVMTIAKNCWLDSWRRNRRESLSLEERDVPSPFRVEDAVLGRLQGEELEKALKSLPPEQAGAIRLKYVERQTLREIARRFSCEPKTVKSRIHNGMVRLRKKLKGDFYRG
ncbi:MAG: sigma-70 family RNA polymerase sigma factor [Oscillospiraceae bacterium]|nr:sigma-70 family RNA polymerase sigma factor [Oscillospiraceae bacterium]MCI2035456.1 sigma-70 family RNA polymerase sigma factor [Oscillospiraceae bacterium]